MHDLLDTLTAALAQSEVNRSANHGGPVALEFAFNRARQNWQRLQVPEMCGQIAAGVAANHGLTTAEARQLSDAITAGLDACNGDQHAGDQWLRAMRGYAEKAAEEV